MCKTHPNLVVCCTPMQDAPQSNLSAREWGGWMAPFFPPNCSAGESCGTIISGVYRVIVRVSCFFLVFVCRIVCRGCTCTSGKRKLTMMVKTQLVIRGTGLSTLRRDPDYIISILGVGVLGRAAVSNEENRLSCKKVTCYFRLLQSVRIALFNITRLAINSLECCFGQG